MRPLPPPSWTFLRLFVISCVPVILAASTSNGRPCDQVHQLTAGRQDQLSTTNVITIDSPNYPFTQYPPRSSCRHSITAPLGYAITVQCNMNLPALRSGSGASATVPDTQSTPFVNSNTNCQTDFLYISTKAADQATDGYFEYFCGRGYVSRTSAFNTMTVAYESRSDTVAGYFSCTAFATKQKCDCGWNPRTHRPGGSSGRIIGGTEAVANEYAAMVGLVDKRTSRVFCGGTISE